jgi:hypothetical protein
VSLADAGDTKETHKELEDVIGVKSKIQRIAIRTRSGGEERRERERERERGARARTEKSEGKTTDALWKKSLMSSMSTQTSSKRNQSLVFLTQTFGICTNTNVENYDVSVIIVDLFA